MQFLVVVSQRPCRRATMPAHGIRQTAFLGSARDNAMITSAVVPRIRVHRPVIDLAFLPVRASRARDGRAHNSVWSTWPGRA